MNEAVIHTNSFTPQHFMRGICLMSLSALLNTVTTMLICSEAVFFSLMYFVSFVISVHVDDKLKTIYVGTFNYTSVK